MRLRLFSISIVMKVDEFIFEGRTLLLRKLEIIIYL